MMLPNIDINDLQTLVPSITNVGTPIRGGQKIVFPCEIDGQKQALKIMLADPNGDASSANTVAARARREVAIMSLCDTPYLVKMGALPLQVAQVNGQDIIYYSEEWIEGSTVRELLQQQGTLPETELIRLANNVVQAIDILWSHNKIHRDIKPGNILRRESNGDYILLDMGITFDLDADSLTQPMIVVGTMQYYSPEQIQIDRKRQMDFRSDLFSLGIVLYEAATGEHPFWSRGANTANVLIGILQDSPRRPLDINPDINVSLDRLIMRMLAKRPHLRYRTCAIFLDTLAKI